MKKMIITSIEEEFQKAQVKGFTRTVRGKIQRVNPFERKGEKKTKTKSSGPGPLVSLGDGYDELKKMAMEYTLTSDFEDSEIKSEAKKVMKMLESKDHSSIISVSSEDPVDSSLWDKIWHYEDSGSLESKISKSKLLGKKRSYDGDFTKHNVNGVDIVRFESDDAGFSRLFFSKNDFDKIFKK
jgi:hypothetical protein